MEYQTLRDNCPTWNDYIYHAFINQLADGTLPKDCFRHYLQQDYLFLIQFIRMFSLTIYKSENIQQMRAGQTIMNSILDNELNLHLAYCQQWGISDHDINHLIESTTTIAYSRLLLDIGMSGSLADLYAGIAPCLMGYGAIGKRLKSQQSNVSDKVLSNPYQSWIDLYASDEYQIITETNETLINELLSDATPTQADKYQKLFNATSKMEVAFWQMGLEIS